VPRRLFLAFAAWAAIVAPAAAQGEHERRLAAELSVVAGDLRRLEAADRLPPQREGLRARIAGALASLGLLLRRAGDDAKAATKLRDAWTRSDMREFGAALDALRRRHPFDARSLLPERSTAAQRAVGEAIHREACAGCHDAPAADAIEAALDLRAEGALRAYEEFAARLLLGVRGDRSTAFHNPFSDLELAALFAWYEDAQPGDRTR